MLVFLRNEGDRGGGVSERRQIVLPRFNKE
ncbi:MAG: hypothetical protein JWL77_1618 [Chthonomonadaceae bacterium]|nr:hypothetical protein [Chthonomonadaceae bacterium]